MDKVGTWKHLDSISGTIIHTPQSTLQDLTTILFYSLNGYYGLKKSNAIVTFSAPSQQYVKTEKTPAHIAITPAGQQPFKHLVYHLNTTSNCTQALKHIQEISSTRNNNNKYVSLAMTRSCNSSQSPRIDHYRLLNAQKTVIIFRVHISGWKLRKVDFVFVRTARPLGFDRPIGCRKASRGHGWFARTGPVSEQRFRQTIEKRANPSPSTTGDELKINKNNNNKKYLRSCRPAPPSFSPSGQSTNHHRVTPTHRCWRLKVLIDRKSAPNRVLRPRLQHKLPGALRVRI